MHYSELVDLWIEGLTTRYTKQAFFEEAQRRGITVAPVNSAPDLADDAHLRATNGWAECDNPGVGVLRTPTPPIHVDGRAATARPAPVGRAQPRGVRR